MNTPTRLDTLAELLKAAPDEIFIQPHNVPDPDAIASCAGLQYLLARRGIPSVIVYDREIEKADSLQMLDLFGIDMQPAASVATLGEEDWAVLVDGQKGGGNLSDLPTDEVACIDHHEYRGNQGYRFEDVRPEVGACSSIIAGYFFENAVEPPVLLATALLFGIMKDTDGLTRGVADFDVEMFYKLFHFSDPGLIKRLNGAQLTRPDLDAYADAFRTIEVYAGIGFMRLDTPDDSLLGSAGDIVLSLDSVEVVVAWAVREAGVKLSVRSESPQVAANGLARFLVDGLGFGGGHAHMAGGFFPADKLPVDRGLDTMLRYRAIRFVEMLAGSTD
ncbi:MAG: DHH family phosphoesterase [Spirochaetes bacterium]|nr:DHH family phosphoesterase [Spirochaetota bacterium]MBU0956358.1 DHH family phosphoesterase [Spirochaetota bacterium]